MSEVKERYSRLFAAPENLYYPGAPVAMAASVLQKDNQSGLVFVQLKLHNLQAKQIKAATVKIFPQDTLGQPLGEALEQQYLDLTAARDADFGPQTPIVMPDAATRAFTACVQEVIFADNTVWQAAPEAGPADWQPLPRALPLADSLQDEELFKQFQLKFGRQCCWAYAPHADLWRCACGAWNLQAEEACHSCRLEAAALAAVDLQALAAEKEQRLAKEAEQAKQRAAEQAAMLAKIKKIALVAVPVLVVLIIALSMFNNAQEKRAQYEQALAYLEQGQYSRAVKEFSALGGYKDSKEQLANAMQGVKFAEALELLQDRDYDAAREALLEIADWGEVQKYLDSFQYVLWQEKGEDGTEKDYYYNDDGSVLHTEQGSVYTEYEYNSDGKLRSTSYSDYPAMEKTTYFYNTQGALREVQEVEYNRSHRRRQTNTEYIFAEGDNPTGKTVTVKEFASSYPYKEVSSVSSTASLTYDGQGRLMEERSVDESGAASVYTFTYDQYGNMTKRSWQKLGADGAVLNSSEENYAYEYDADGNMLSKQTNGQAKIIYTYAYMFFNNQNLPMSAQ